MSKGQVPPIVDPFLDKVRQAVREHGMFAKGASILLGVSGGPDSVALVQAMVSLKEEYALTLGIAHVNHCLRGSESDRDAQFVEDLANRLNIPFYIKTTDVARAQKNSGLSLEETAREVRKSFFSFLIHEHGYDHVALGHHADDNAEWVLISLIRGAGSGGLSGIPPVNGAVVRPLFNLTREEILEYCRKQGLQWVLDSSNEDQSILRNQIRHHLLPLLENQYNPSIKQGLNRLSDILREEHQWMDSLAREFLDRHARPVTNGVGVPLKHFRKLPLALRRRIALLAMARVRGNTRKTSWTHVRDVLELCDSKRTGGQIHLPQGLEARRTRDALEFVLHASSDWARTLQEAGEEWQAILEGPGIYPVPQAGFSVSCSVEEYSDGFKLGENESEVCLDFDYTPFPLKIRPWRPGDRFTPLGASGSQKLSKFLIDHKIPGQDRENIYVLISNENIVWLMGYRLSENAKIHSETRHVLRCKVLLA